MTDFITNSHIDKLVAAYELVTLSLLCMNIITMYSLKDEIFCETKIIIWLLGAIIIPIIRYINFVYNSDVIKYSEMFISKFWIILGNNFYFSLNHCSPTIKQLLLTNIIFFYQQFFIGVTLYVYYHWYINEEDNNDNANDNDDNDDENIYEDDDDDDDNILENTNRPYHLRKTKYGTHTSSESHGIIYSIIINHEDAKCTICLQEYINDENIVVLHCGHHYHHVCINFWMDYKTTCPICVTHFA